MSLTRSLSKKLSGRFSLTRPGSSIKEEKGGRGSDRQQSIASLLGNFTNAQNHCQVFDVLKIIKKWGKTRHQLRTWEVDVNSGCIRNMTRSGQLQKEFKVDDLEIIEKPPGEPQSLFIRFGSANHGYTLLFEDMSNGCAEMKRESFYQLIYLLRIRARTAMVPIVERAGLEQIVSTGVENMRVFIGTWNLGNAPPPPTDMLSSFLPRDGAHDVYVIGTQECLYEPRAGYESCDEDWQATLQRHFGPEYCIVAHKAMVAIRIVVLVHQRHAFKISAVSSGSVGTGLGNMYGNKGGVGVCFMCHSTLMTFMSVHLAARIANVKERNIDAAMIIDSLRLGMTPELDAPAQSAYTFFFGDMNYRVDMPYDHTVELCHKGSIPELVAGDQFAREQEAGRVLSNFKEGGINFIPTYRYEIGSRQFSCKKEQSPSYTDRILYKALPGYSVAQRTYDATHAVTTSDHSPVFAVFDVTSHLPPIAMLTTATSAPECQCLVNLSRCSAYNLRLYDVAMDAEEEARTERSLNDTKRHNGALLFLKFYSLLGFHGPCVSTATGAFSLVEHQGQGRATNVEMTAEWEDSQICALRPRVLCREQLLQHPLMVVLLEQTESLISGVSGGDRVIGQGCIYLGNTVSNKHAKYVNFSTSLDKRGVTRGSLQGTVKVTWL